MVVDEAEQHRMAEMAELARGVADDGERQGLEADAGRVSSAFKNLLSELQEKRSKMDASLFMDVLTGIANRRSFIEHADAALRIAKRNGSVMALAYINLDDFGIFNESNGHEAGDSLLVSIAKRLQAQVREVDTVARLGADEFTVIFHDVGSKAFVERMTNRIFAGLSEPLELSESLILQPDCSIGVVLSDGIEELTHLMWRAERAMNYVKQQGKGHYLVKDLFED